MSVDDRKLFEEQRKNQVNVAYNNKEFGEVSKNWLEQSVKHKYSYNFDWLGVPIIQYPQDLVALQEVIWKTKPDIIIETGVARGGSLILSASILHLINGTGKVVGIDIDIRAHNRVVIEKHPLAFRIKLIQGSSTDKSILEKIKTFIKPQEKVMVILASNHTHEHVLNELYLYAPLVSKGFYLVVMDTVVDDMPDDFFPDRPWGKRNNPKTAIDEFLTSSSRFQIDESVHEKLLITGAKNGFLKCLE